MSKRTSHPQGRQRAPRAGEYRAGEYRLTAETRTGKGPAYTVATGKPLPPEDAATSTSPRMDEAEYLLSSPENARRLRRSIADADAGNVIERELVECD